jgi:phosphohistidine phosphatase
MTLRLWILRHAKAAPEGPGGDSTRPLTGKGKRQTDAVRLHLESFPIQADLPALVLCSPATRARQTADRVLPAMPGARLDIETAIYSGDASGLAELLRNDDPEETTVMIVGHNPTLLDLCLMLSDPVDSDVLERSGLPTAGLVVLDQPDASHWHELAQGSARLTHRFVPEVGDTHTRGHG